MVLFVVYLQREPGLDSERSKLSDQTAENLREQSFVFVRGREGAVPVGHTGESAHTQQV